MTNIKTFWKDHKQQLKVAGCVVGAVLIGAVAYTVGNERRVDKNGDLEGKNIVAWTPTDSFINLERVKEILDLNADNTESFAIFREGLEADQYACVLISDNVITTSEI